MKGAARAIAWAVMAGSAGCAAPVGDPAWALDTTWLFPDGASDITGVQSWALFDALYVERRSPKRFVCTVLVELTGTPAEAPCEGCTAWDTVAVQQGEDCPRGALARLDVFEGITGVGIGPVRRDLQDPPPHASVEGAWVRYPETGWIGHGWAWPDGLLEDEVSPGPWDGSRTFVLWPGEAWDLTSRFAREEREDAQGGGG